jgi:hypothetical protein
LVHVVLPVAAKMAGLSFKDWNSRMDLFSGRHDVDDDEEEDDDEEGVWTPAYGFPYSSEDNLFLASTADEQGMAYFGVRALTDRVQGQRRVSF